VPGTTTESTTEAAGAEACAAATIASSATCRGAGATRSSVA
jgi:hypothetical protein